MPNNLTGGPSVAIWQIVILELYIHFFLLCAASKDTAVQSPVEIPCPEKWDPSPCACYDDSTVTSLSCSNVQSTQELMTIFASLKKPVQFSEFRLSSSNVTSLPAGVFGKASFTAIQIHDTTLETIDEGSFQGLENTLSALAIWNNKVNLIDYKALRGLKHLHGFHVSSEKITEIPDYAFSNLSSLCLIDIIASEIESIGTGAFANISNIIEIIFTNNRVPVKKVGDFAFSNPMAKKLKRFVFSRNNLTQAALSENSFHGLNTSFIDLQGNQLEFLHQNVFEKVIQTVSEKPKGVIMGFGNPIKCDHTMKWLVDKRLKFKKTLVGFECPNKKFISELTEEELAP